MMVSTSNHLCAVAGQSAVWFQYGGGILTYREEKFEMAMLLFEHVDGFEVAK
jgi:hypothetical protein